MAKEITGSVKAGADLSGGQYKFITGAGGYSGAPLTAVGVLQNKPDAAGKAASYISIGETKVIAGGVVTLGTHYLTVTSGFATATTSHMVAIGKPLETAASGDIIRAIINCAG